MIRGISAVLICAMSALSADTFEVASIRRHAGGCGFAMLSFDESPGRFSRCGSLANFIQIAYAPSGQLPGHPHRKLLIMGGPPWVGSFNDLYDINAKAGGPALSAQTEGPMLQMLLESRFQLRLHRETRQQPVYYLTRVRQGRGLKAIGEDACLAAAKCPAISIDGNGPNTSMEIHGETMEEFAITLSLQGRPVIDKTGLIGLYDIHLKYPNLKYPNDEPSADARNRTWGEAIFDALQSQVGLKLVSATGPVEVLVIDHAERPSAN